MCIMVEKSYSVSWVTNIYKLAIGVFEMHRQVGLFDNVYWDNRQILSLLVGITDSGDPSRERSCTTRLA